MTFIYFPRIHTHAKISNKKISDSNVARKISTSLEEQKSSRKKLYIVIFEDDGMKSSSAYQNLIKAFHCEKRYVSFSVFHFSFLSFFLLFSSYRKFLDNEATTYFCDTHSTRSGTLCTQKEYRETIGIFDLGIFIRHVGSLRLRSLAATICRMLVGCLCKCC